MSQLLAKPPTFRPDSQWCDMKDNTFTQGNEVVTLKTIAKLHSKFEYA